MVQRIQKYTKLNTYVHRNFLVHVGKFVFVVFIFVVFCCFFFILCVHFFMLIKFISFFNKIWCFLNFILLPQTLISILFCISLQVLHYTIFSFENMILSAKFLNLYSTCPFYKSKILVDNKFIFNFLFSIWKLKPTVTKAVDHADEMVEVRTKDLNHIFTVHHVQEEKKTSYKKKNPQTY